MIDQFTNTNDQYTSEIFCFHVFFNFHKPSATSPPTINTTRALNTQQAFRSFFHALLHRSFLPHLISMKVYFIHKLSQRLSISLDWTTVFFFPEEEEDHIITICNNELVVVYNRNQENVDHIHSLK